MIPQVSIGDTVLFVSHFSEGSAIYGSKPNRTLPAIVVGIEANGLPSLQVFNYGISGPSFTAAVEYDATGKRPGTWRVR